MNGQGTFVFCNGDMYSGEWKDGVANGKGLYTWKVTDDRYMGEFLNMKRHGSGTMLFQNGHKYDGLFYNDYRYGHGVETFANGNRYEGYWIMDKRHGYGLAYIKFDNLDKKLQKKRKQLVKGQSFNGSSNSSNNSNSNNSSTTTNNGNTINNLYINNLHSIDNYVIYLQEYQIGKLLNEKELFPTDYNQYLPSNPNQEQHLKPPKELFNEEINEILFKIDEEIQLLVEDSNGQLKLSNHHHDNHSNNNNNNDNNNTSPSMDDINGNNNTNIEDVSPLSRNSHLSEIVQPILCTDNVFVQGVVCWEDKYWDMIQQLFVQQYTFKCELNHSKKLLQQLDQLTYLEQRRMEILEKIEMCNNAKTKTKWEMKRVIVEELNSEAPNDYSGVDLFQDRLDELISEMKLELTEILQLKNNASQERDEKKIQQTSQQVSDIEKKIFRLESALQTAKNTSIQNPKLKQVREHALYSQLLETVAIHLQRLRVLLRRLMSFKYGLGAVIFTPNQLDIVINNNNGGANEEELNNTKNLIMLVQGLFESNIVRSRDQIAQHLKIAGIDADNILKRTRSISDDLQKQ
ncbi:predicted protein [Naegleria gruberi]|uniref:Predicted protein n=1 Tax=Naegleria gruberi TaxID=5762 RepID=D2VRJ8_NAEGR|nr:uncharacterized protein NAEGRDRAFT_51697 [Naegleria gruberi]EFC40616.1 predicted protein [Naegleria gruberi]|eukprot:XP_002673360.1 predicted protein [Naegleria gruberi strain NEG-M]